MRYWWDISNITCVNDSDCFYGCLIIRDYIFLTVLQWDKCQKMKEREIKKGDPEGEPWHELDGFVN